MTGVLPQENIEKRRAFKKQPGIARFFFEYTWYGLEGMGRKVWPGKCGPESMGVESMGWKIATCKPGS